MIPTWILLPVSGTMPSSVKIISNFSSLKLSGDMVHRGEDSSILRSWGREGHNLKTIISAHLWDSTMGQYIWKKSCVPSRSVPNPMANR